MKKSELLEFINKETKGKFVNFKLSNVLYNESENLATFRFVHLDDTSEQDRQELIKLIKKFIKTDTEINVKFHKAFIDEDICATFIKNYIMKNYPNIYGSFSIKDIVIKFEGDVVFVTISFPEVFYNFLIKKDFQKELYKSLETQFFNNFIIELTVKEGVSLSDGLNKWKKKVDKTITALTPEDSDSKYQVSDLKTFIGNEINNCVTPIIRLKPEMVGTVVAGKLQEPQKRTFIRKNKKTNIDEERIYFNFFLQDDTGRAKCVLFPGKENAEKFETLKEGQEVAVYGDVDDYNGNISVKVKNISLCTLANIEAKAEKKYKNANDEYYYIKPQEFITVEQRGLFEVEKKYNSFIMNNEFVVFDLETTGLKPAEDEIVEIGAVKVKNGKIVETFSSLVKPKNGIPEDATKIHGITEQMVEKAPSIEKALPDFFKFANEAYLVAYNIDFDFSFISAAALHMGYKFTNKLIDAMAVAKGCIPSLRNYTLKSVTTALNISLENAHRAINDAIATAKVFLELGDKVQNFVR